MKIVEDWKDIIIMRSKVLDIHSTFRMTMECISVGGHVFHCTDDFLFTTKDGMRKVCSHFDMERLDEVIYLHENGMWSMWQFPKGCTKGHKWIE